jgi:hypothetical protein
MMNCVNLQFVSVTGMLMTLSKKLQWSFWKVNDGGYLRYYVVRTMMTMATSPRSTFARKHGLFAHSNQVPDIADDADGYDWDQEDDITIIEALLDSYHWYDKKVLELWLQEGSYRKVSKKVDIPFKSIGNSVRRTLDQLKEDYYGIILQRCISSGHRITTDRSDKHSDLH